MLPVVTVWQRGKPEPEDLPRGRYVFVYRVAGPLALPTLLAVRKMLGKTRAEGSNEVKITGYRVVSRPFSFYTDFHLDCEVIGAAPLLVGAMIAAIALGLTGAALFGWMSCVEIRKVLSTEGGQDWLRESGGAIKPLVNVAGIAIVGLLVAGAGFLAFQRVRAK